MKAAIVLLAFMAFAAVQSASATVIINRERPLKRIIMRGKHAWEKLTADKDFMDKEMLTKQKVILDLFKGVWGPLQLKEYDGLGEKFIIEDNMFSNYDESMEDFKLWWLDGKVLPKGQYFTIFNMVYLRQTRGLAKMLYFAKDWETFKDIAIWARRNVNEGMFATAMSIAIMHREDMKFIVIPALNEIVPQLFFNSKLISKVKNFDKEMWKEELKQGKELEEQWKKMKSLRKENSTTWNLEKDWRRFDGDSKLWELKWNEAEKEKKILRKEEKDSFKDSEWIDMMKDTKMFWLKADYTDDIKPLNEESKLTYLTEDADWNMYWYYLNMEFPFFLKADDLGLEKERRGEWWLFNIQQILARYYHERLSRGLGKIPEFSWYSSVKVGYNPQLRLNNGLGYSERKNYWEVFTTENYKLLNDIQDFERRIRDAIDYGTYTTVDGTKFDLRDKGAIDLIGNWMQGNSDSIDRRFFGVWMLFAHLTAAGADNDFVRSGDKSLDVLMPNVMLHFETMLRDPLFYMMYKRVADIYFRFKFQLGPYQKEELLFKGVKVEDFEVGELKTFFAWSDSDVTTLINSKYALKDGKWDWSTMLMARRQRLDHEQFTMKYNITSDKNQTSIIRLFLGPKFDKYGRELTMKTNRRNFVELDEFEWELNPGENVIKRSSEDFFWTRKDFTTYTELYKKVMLAIDGKAEFSKKKEQVERCAFPERLLLPRGWVDGMPMKVFIIVSPADGKSKEYSADKHMISCGSEFDSRAYGFPLDREIEPIKFWVPNMFMKDVKIFHDEKDIKTIE